MATLPNIWDYDDPPTLPIFHKIGAFAKDLHSKQLPDADRGVIRFFSLYWFIMTHLDMPADALRRRIVSRGTPIFSPHEFEGVLDTIRKQKDSSFAQRLRNMTGGATKATRGGGPAPAVTPPLPQGSGLPPSPLDGDPSRSKFWDVLLRTQLYKLTKNLPPAFDGFAPIIFGLYGLEQIEVLGPLIATGLDTVTLGLPILGKLMGTAFSKIVALAPIPYAGPVGDIIAYFIALVFIMISATMSVGRKQFGTSFTVGLGAIPIIGDNISDAALLFEKQVERYENNKKKLLDSMDKVSPHTADFLDYWLPSKTEKTGPPVAFDPDMVLLDALAKATDAVGEESAISAIPYPEEMPKEARNIIKNPELKQLLGPENKKGGRRKTRRLGLRSRK